ncbi:hypothetical protein D3C73_1194650 [compost metagenome]
MLDPQLGQTHHVATTVDFLGRAQGAGTRVTDTVVGDVLAITVGQLDLGLGVIPAQQFLQVQRRTQTELVGITRGLVVVVAAVQVAAHLADVVHFDVDTLFDQSGSLTTPVTGHPFGISGERIGRLDTAGQHHCRNCR